MIFELSIQSPACSATMGAGVPFQVKIAFLEVLGGLKPVSHFLETVMALAPYSMSAATQLAAACGLYGT